MAKIEDWIKEELKRGITPEKIKKSLVNSGWNPVLIDKLLEEVQDNDLKKNFFRFLNKNFLILIAVVMIFIVGIFAYITVTQSKNIENPVTTTTVKTTEGLGYIEIDMVNCDTGDVYVRNMGSNTIEKNKITVKAGEESKRNSEEVIPSDVVRISFGHSVSGKIIAESANKRYYYCWEK